MGQVMNWQLLHDSQIDSILIDKQLDELDTQNLPSNHLDQEVSDDLGTKDFKKKPAIKTKPQKSEKNPKNYDDLKEDIISDNYADQLINQLKKDYNSRAQRQNIDGKHHRRESPLPSRQRRTPSNDVRRDHRSQDA